MKKMIAFLTALTLCLTLCMTAVSAGETLGGWEIPSAEGEPLTEEAQAAFDKAMGKLVGAAYAPVALLATQVVAGTNYCILCRMTPVVPNPKPQWTLVYIYEDLEGNAKIMNIHELDIGLYAYPTEE
ncbi:MAG: hypothetical protein IKG23_04245 [Clostridia bacterium]|nr:hypothetical protein [Clostridia bacterium]